MVMVTKCQGPDTSFDDFAVIRSIDKAQRLMLVQHVEPISVINLARGSAQLMVKRAMPLVAVFSFRGQRIGFAYKALDQVCLPLPHTFDTQCCQTGSEKVLGINTWNSVHVVQFVGAQKPHLQMYREKALLLSQSYSTGCLSPFAMHVIKWSAKLLDIHIGSDVATDIYLDGAHSCSTYLSGRFAIGNIGAHST